MSLFAYNVTLKVYLLTTLAFQPGCEGPYNQTLVKQGWCSDSTTIDCCTRMMRYYHLTPNICVNGNMSQCTSDWKAPSSPDSHEQPKFNHYLVGFVCVCLLAVVILVGYYFHNRKSRTMTYQPL